jgi:methylenetetrahydrofolate dehydrogenase (NADP+) / methenyltetrahydrofolate cyclohydrolase
MKHYVALEKAALTTFAKGLTVKPHLVIIQANDNEGSNIYIKGKIADCAEVGFQATHLKLSPTVTQAELIDIIQRYNEDPNVHGVIVQVPLPDHIDQQAIKLAVFPLKDVDGFHPLSPMMACTPKGIIDYLKFEGYSLSGKHVVVLGRSYIVGRPLAKMMVDENATVTTLHSRSSETDRLNALASADLICVAIGKKGYISNQPLKPTAWIIDIGITREEGQIYGDVLPNRPVAFQSPVPGGVGLLTRLALLKNLKEAYTKRFPPKPIND